MLVFVSWNSIKCLECFTFPSTQGFDGGVFDSPFCCRGGGPDSESTCMASVHVE